MSMHLSWIFITCFLAGVNCVRASSYYTQGAQYLSRANDVTLSIVQIESKESVENAFAIARVLIHEPNNVILDEPTAGLDVKGTRAMRAVIRDLKALGKCVVFSTHVMQEVAALCDRVVVIAHGRVTASGTPDELRKATGKDVLEDAFVAAVGDEEGLA